MQTPPFIRRLTPLLSVLAIMETACAKDHQGEADLRDSTNGLAAEKQHNKKAERASNLNYYAARDNDRTLANSAGGGCDQTLWKRVYKPSRLRVVSDCITASGVIVAIGPDDDGDEHMLLRLDAGQENLVNRRNVKKKDGNLVAEVVCANAAKLRRAIRSCSGYRSAIPLPSVADHVEITGSYVIDTHNGWAEIHPVTKIVSR